MSWRRFSACGIYRSDDADLTANYVGPMDGLWGGTQSMAAFAFDAQRLIYSGVEAQRSTDGGATAVSINTWGSYYGNPANRLHSLAAAAAAVEVEEEEATKVVLRGSPGRFRSLGFLRRTQEVPPPRNPAESHPSIPLEWTIHRRSFAARAVTQRSSEFPVAPQPSHPDVALRKQELRR